MKFLWLLAVCVAVCQCQDGGVMLNTDKSDIFDSPANEANINTRIVNGQRAPLGIFPWHALLQIERYGVNSIFYCGGAILNRNWVLTSADCLQDASRVRIDAGSVELRRPAVTVLADAFFTPRDYNPRDFANNLALLRIPLQSSLNFTYSPTANLAPIRLPALSQERETFVDQEAHFTGFGYTMKGRPVMSDFLLYTRKRVISNQECLSYFNNNANLIRPTVVCAYSYDIREAPCGGDGGGPLAINEFGTWTLIGTLSFLHSEGSCGSRQVPTVYTRLTSRTYTDWIRQTANYQFRP